MCSSPSHPLLWLRSPQVNSAVKQDGVTSDMIFSVPTLISYISTIYTLEDGDLIFTGASGPSQSTALFAYTVFAQCDVRSVLLISA